MERLDLSFRTIIIELGKSLPISEPQFPQLSSEDEITYSLYHCHKDPISVYEKSVLQSIQHYVNVSYYTFNST